MTNDLILLDAAKMEELFDEVKQLNPKHNCLYRNPNNELKQVAPYLFTLLDNPTLMSFFHKKGWGNSWGYILSSSFDFSSIYRHLTNSLFVKTEDQQELYFRFYDPRVLRIFLPTCDTKQLKEFFGPVDYFICEDEDPAYGLVFSLSKNHQLITKQLTKEEIFGQANQVTLEKNHIIQE